VRAVGDRLGPILVQLPDERRRDERFLQLLLDLLDPELSYAVELREASWRVPSVEQLIASRGRASRGVVARPQRRAADRLALRGFGRATGGETPLRYLRLREPPYDDEALRSLAASAGEAATHAIDVYCFFKHEDEPRGARYAARLLALAVAAP
jgi:uncharacterized protein YecE (DUF72 family)